MHESSLEKHKRNLYSVKARKSLLEDEWYYQACQESRPKTAINSSHLKCRLTVENLSAWDCNTYTHEASNKLEQGHAHRVAPKLAL